MPVSASYALPYHTHTCSCTHHARKAEGEPLYNLYRNDFSKILIKLRKTYKGPVVLVSYFRGFDHHIVQKEIIFNEPFLKNSNLKIFSGDHYLMVHLPSSDNFNSMVALSDGCTARIDRFPVMSEIMPFLLHLRSE